MKFTAGPLFYSLISLKNPISVRLQIGLLYRFEIILIKKITCHCGIYPNVMTIPSRIKWKTLKWTPLSRHKFTENKVESFPVLPIYYPSPLS